MDDLLDIMRSMSKLQLEMEAIRKAHFEELDQLFFGITSAVAEVKPTEIVPPVQPSSSSVTPQQTKKRPKRLTSLVEDDGDEESIAASEVSQRQSARMSNSQLLAVAQEEDVVNTTGTLMPPPPAPVTAAAETSMSTGRPQRAAKLRSEKKLKEPQLNTKMRRPSEEETVKIKLESEQRASQLHRISSLSITQAAAAPAVAAPSEPTAPAEERKAEEPDLATTNFRIKVKREKLSVDTTATTTATLEATKSTTDESSVLSTTTAANNTTTSGATKKSRKKKEAHKPIKVERFSDIDKNLPVSSRTRLGSNGARNSQESQAPPPQASIYEDAVDDVPNATATAGAVAANETVTLPHETVGAGINEATFNMPTSNATMRLSDHVASNATFQVDAGGTDSEKEQSMKTAREGSIPETAQNNSLMTEDESVHEAAKAPTINANPVPKVPTSIKGIKMPARTHELFNPLLQSPVKMRVEAFENAANAQSNLRSKRIKDAGMPGSSTTPVIGKLGAPTLGRFLTPTQSSNALPVNSAQPKKAPMSACKATPLMKTATGTNLKSTNSSSSKTLTRENSGEDFRKGLHLLAEERKKQREQKHLQAAQLREAKERERAERMAKLAKEREEKRIKKQQEKEKLELRKRLEMEELQRKLLQQEEAERIKKQERELLQQMKLQQLNAAKAKQMMPPPPKSKYTFEMLHEDDSTDDEGKVSYKRPPVPSWSRAHVRGAAICVQTFCPTDIIDSFFSVAPQTPDLKKIFPNIDPSHLKRNSSVLWSTPPRYSELPKY
ncbi:histone-lysine N-methyltransferase, H3 lysine-79 specific isoform X2 [Drosophila montana]|uniref:histone-lysine N-methyltransferase, H3 lysine-79 specific isoform X2 n=1 Tax=Drosophila montana TaxID=40370 RepID=UPI00313AA376